MKFCFVLIGRIGDLILSTPAFSAIKREYESAYVTAIISRGNMAVLRNNPFVDEIVEYSNTAKGYCNLLHFLANNSFDYWIDPKDHYSTTSHYLGLFAKAINKIGFEKPAPKHRFVFNHALSDLSADTSLHFVGMLGTALRQANIKINYISDYFSQLYLDDEAINKAKGYFCSLPKGKVRLLINLSASSPRRIYSLENWRKFFCMTNFDKYAPTLISMPKEHTLAQTLLAEFPCLYEHETGSLENFFALIHECDILISPDTSAVHVAAAFSKPAIALYGFDRRNMSRFAPLARNLNSTFFVLAPRENDPHADNINSIPPLNIHRHLEKIYSAIKFK